MKRRDFIQSTAFGVIGLSLPASTLLLGCKDAKSKKHFQEFQKEAYQLLKNWCDGMLKVQINEPGNSEIHGALGCPACNKIHGRCMDAIYPFLYMADYTGEEKYLTAAINLFSWSKNVSMPDGSWTVIPDPKSWRGITVFGAIALGEALHYHGHLLDEERKAEWTKRLERAGDYIFQNFNMTFTNVNYGFTAVYALNMLGKQLSKPAWVEKSRDMAREVKTFFTKPNKLLFGEGKPSTAKSEKGLYPVDLGYNVEESLNNVVLYALSENDNELINLLSESLESHLEFMLPDGAWDNSWGTRQAKWSYWGSRTTDGSQIAYAMMAHRKKEFSTAVVKTTHLLKQCTSAGLLHGGPHYVSHGVKPCVHHTFAHAKPLAFLLDMGSKLPIIESEVPLPRSVKEGVKEFPEISTWLFGKGDWRGTVTSYDFIYKKGIQQATGGAMSVLYHLKAGLVFAASMAKYVLVEKNNMQPNPGEDFPLTPRIESWVENKWFTNLYDLEAKVETQSSTQGIIAFDVITKLKDEERIPVHGTTSEFNLVYQCDQDKISLKAKPINGKISEITSLVLPVISPSGEGVSQTSPNKIEIQKPNGVLLIEANVPLIIKKTAKQRVFNMVPGAEAVPILAHFEIGYDKEIVCQLSFVETKS